MINTQEIEIIEMTPEELDIYILGLSTQSTEEK